MGDLMTPIEGIVSLATKPIANGITRKVVWISVTVIVMLAGGIFLISGKYTYVISSCESVAQHEKQINKLNTDVAELKGDVRYAKDGIDLLLKAQGISRPKRG